MRLKRTIISIGVFSLCMVPAVTLAQVEFDPNKNDPGHTSIKAFTFLSGAYDPVTASIRLINVALSFLGMISIILFLYAGVIWFRSGDNEEDVKKAKDIIKGAIIGLVLTLGAYGISYLAFGQITNSTLLTNDAYNAQYAQ